MKRRDLMKLAPAALIVTAPQGAANAAEETPVMRLFKEWRAADTDFIAAEEVDADRRL